MYFRLLFRGKKIGDEMSDDTVMYAFKSQKAWSELDRILKKHNIAKTKELVDDMEEFFHNFL